VAAYYLYFRPRLDALTVAHMEGLRIGLGLWARLLYDAELVNHMVTRSKA